VTRKNSYKLTVFLLLMYAHTLFRGLGGCLLERALNNIILMDNKNVLW